MMRPAKFATITLGLAALLLAAGVRAQSSNPAQTIQGAKQQVTKAASGSAAQGQKAASAPKQQVAQSATAKNQAAPAAKQPQGAAPAAKTSASASSKSPAKTQAKSPAGTTSKTAAKTAQKASAKEAAKAPSKAPANAAAQAQKKPSGKAPAKAAENKAKPAAAKEEPKIARRDPFAPLINQKRGNGPSVEHLPPGKAGLVIATLRIQGVVRGPNGMIAIVANPQQSVYFLREGDQLYDGRVVSIKLDEVAFHEYGKDAFGNPIDRQVSKRLYPIAGEQ